MNQKRFAVPVHTLFVVPVVAADAVEAAELARRGIARMLHNTELTSALTNSFHVEAASVLTSPNDVTELPPPT